MRKEKRTTEDEILDVITESMDTLLLLLSCFSRVRLCATPQMAGYHPWDSPGKNTGVGFHFFLQCMKVKSEIEVALSCPTLCDSMDCSLPGSSIHGIFQARVLEWVAISYSTMDMSLSKLQGWWWTGRSDMLRSRGSQRVRDNWATELNWISKNLFVTLFYSVTEISSDTDIFVDIDLLGCKEWCLFIIYLLIILTMCI